MQHISMTPFGRKLRAADLQAAHMASRALPEHARDKWEVMKDLTVARRTFGVSDRDLAVLNALVSFHPHATLAQGDGSIVFPSNESLSARAHGMPESTLRRHLGALVKAGLILRHDSPNGKRYARRSGGQIFVAYGFDLRPLMLRDAEIIEAAADAREAEMQRKALREAIVLTLRDLRGLTSLAAPLPAQAERIEEITRHLRRKLCLTELRHLHLLAHNLREELKALNTHEITEEPSGNTHRNERHIQDSNRYLSESESPMKDAPVETAAPCPEVVQDLTLEDVLDACPEAISFSVHPIRSWMDLVTLAAFLAPMIGITPVSWQAACTTLGEVSAAVTLMAILQKGDQIRNPGGYLTALLRKAHEEGFSPAPMIGALRRLHPRLAA